MPLDPQDNAGNSPRQTRNLAKVKFGASASVVEKHPLAAVMSNLLVLVFVIEAVVHTVNAVGAATINNLVRPMVELFAG